MASSRGPEPRLRAALLSPPAVIGALFLPLLGACGSPGPGTAPPSGAPTEVSRLECEIDGYPCTWAEVPDEVLDRTDRVALVAAALMREVRDPESVAEFLSEEVELAALSWGDTAVRFRLPGSRPVWIPLPFDPQNPRRGGGSGGLRSIASGTTAILASPLSAQTGSPADKIAAAQIGQGKKALVLAPFYYHIGKETTDVYAEFAKSPNYSTKKGGKVELRANLSSHRENAAAQTSETKAVSGQVTIADFMDWTSYDFVYLATHGYADCPTDTHDPENRALYQKRVQQLLPQIKAGKCHTVISVQEFPVGVDDPNLTDDQRRARSTLVDRARQARNSFGHREWTLPGVDVVYETVKDALHPGLSPAEAEWCSNQKNRNATAPNTTKPCYQAEDIPVHVAVTSEFFEHQYPGGFKDIVLFLAACEAMWVDDLKDTLAPKGNHDVAVFGFNRAVLDSEARTLGTLAVRLFLDPGYDHRKVLATLQAEAAKAGIPHFDGVVRGRRGAAPGSQVAEASSNPTHARDVVELLDPRTGEELEDGATVRVRGCPGDGKNDALVVHPVVVGVDEPADLGATSLRVAVGGREPGRSYRPDRLLEEGKYVWLDDVDLGRDAREGEEIVDLEVRGELPENGRSLWRYEDIVLEASGPCACAFSATLSGHTHKGTVQGAWAVFSTRGQVGLMGGMGGRVTAEAKEDLLAAMKMAQGLQGLTGGAGVSQEMQDRLMERLQGEIDEEKEARGPSGSTLGISLVESGDGHVGPDPTGGQATAFKLDAFSEQGIEPGFTGEVPLDRLAFHTGEYASEGLAPTLYRWDRETAGSATLTVREYDGQWLEGTVTADLPAIPGLMKLDGGKPWVRVSADFVAGLFNPLRMENVCLMAKAFGE